MLSQFDFHQALWNLDPRKRLIYDAGVVVQLGITVIVCLGLIGGLSALLARRLVDPDVSQEGLIAAVIMPTLLAFLVVCTVIRGFTRLGTTLSRTLLIALFDGLRLGLIMGFVVVTFWHYLGQLAMARAIYGALEYHAHPSAYCSFRAAFYGLLFAVPVALGSALFTAVFKVGPHVTLNWVNRLPD
jgi:hypothetical protein